MLSRTIRRSILDSRISTSALPPTFLLPCRARYFNSTAQHIEPSPDSSSTVHTIDPTAAAEIPKSAATLAKKPYLRTVPLKPTVISTTPLTLDASVKEMLPLLAVQPEHYISIHIHGKPYLVRKGDSVRLPFLMPGVVPGDVLRLNRALSIGSRDYTLNGAPYVDERIFQCRATVIGTEAEPMRIKEKTKRRNRKVKTVRSKHKFTILKIAELRIKNLDELKEGSTHWA